ncbi:hypothetical protein ACMFMG_002594 [Clarireedia jacksonii]
MSGVTANGGGKTGKAAISTWISYNRRPLKPFLYRNVERALQHATMGFSLSSLKSSVQGLERVILESGDDEDDDPRPAKRRKMMDNNSKSRLAENIQISTRVPNKVQSLKPSDFYGSSALASPAPESDREAEVPCRDQSQIDSVLKLSKTPINFKKLLQIRLHGINHNLSAVNGNAFIGNGIVPPTKIRCTLALFHVLEDDSMMDIYRVVETGTIRRSSEHHGNGFSRISLPPFHIPAAVLFQDQDPELDTPPSGSQQTSDFGKYTVQLMIEPQLVRKDWLPLTANNFPKNSDFGRKVAAGEITLNRIRQLICEFPLFESEWKSNSTRISVIYDKTNVSTSASLKVDVLWSLPSHLSKAHKTLIKSEEDSQWGMETISEPSSAAPPSPGEQLSLRSEPESPARGHRRRVNVPTYNLKALSAKAQGKLPRAQRNRDAQYELHGPSSDPDTLGVTYSFSKNDSSDYGIKQQHSVAGLTCPICSSDHKSVEKLHFHLSTNHTQFKFHLRRSSPPRILFLVELNRPSKGATNRGLHDQFRTMQLGKATSLLDMEKYLNGDQTWLKTRQGPQHDEWPEHLKYRLNDPFLSSLEGSRQSSPDEAGSSRSTEQVPQLTSLPIRQRKKFYVPNTKTPLYDLITKRVLVPGEELPDSDDEKDESWLFQKQRDLVNDFTDVTDDEKDYIIRWNDYILPLRLTADTYLPAALVRFVELNRIWFAERHSRKRELLKYIEGNVMRGSINEDRHDAFLSACIQHLQKGEEEYAEIEREQEGTRQNKDPPQPPLPKPKCSRGYGVCVCGDLVRPIESVLCHDFDCMGRHYHQKCAAKQGRVVDKRSWICDDCLGRRAASGDGATREKNHTGGNGH